MIVGFLSAITYLFCIVFSTVVTSDNVLSHNRIVKTRKGKQLYLVDANGYKHPFLSWDIYSAYGYYAGDIEVISDEDFDLMPLEPPLIIPKDVTRSIYYKFYKVFCQIRSLHYYIYLYLY